MGQTPGGSPNSCTHRWGSCRCERQHDKCRRSSSDYRHEKYGNNPMKDLADCCLGCCYNNRHHTSRQSTRIHYRSYRKCPIHWHFLYLRYVMHCLSYYCTKLHHLWYCCAISIAVATVTPKCGKFPFGFGG